MKFKDYSTKYLVIGGAGYLGSHLVQKLVELNHEVVVFDNYSGNVKVNDLIGVTYVNGSIVNILDFEALRAHGPYDGVFHLAAKKSVAESMINPKEFNLVNVLGTKNLIEFCAELEIQKLVFTSSAAVYGTSDSNSLISELHPISPINPYGVSKVESEEVINHASASGKVRAVILRSYNIAGGSTPKFFDLSGENIFPILMNCILNKKEFTIFGDSFNTPDGTCIRDYINVSDVAVAHINAMKYLQNNSEIQYEVFNICSGQGTSLLEIIKYISNISASEFNWKVTEARNGDPASSIGDNRKAINLLGWIPSKSIDITIKETLKLSGLEFN